MTTEYDFNNRVMSQSQTALEKLVQLKEVADFVDDSLPIPQPYLGSGDIRLVIIGQDPTVQRQSSRKQIKTVLNLDKNGALKSYLEVLCHDLGLSLAENVYATNACKNFFKEPPTAIKELNVLEVSASIWLPVLRIELALFPEAMVISLGEPVLTMLIKPDFPQQMRYYWGYHQQWRQGKSKPVHTIAVNESTVERTIFPFVHQPTMRGQRAAFYRQKRQEYLEFIRTHSGL